MDDLSNKNSLMIPENDEANSIKNKASIKGLDSPFPTCIVGSNGKISSANQFIDKVFLYDALEEKDFFALTSVKLETLEEICKENLYITIERNKCIFRLLVATTETGSYLVTFEDVTAFEELRLKYIGNRNCMGKISIDNYEELQNRVSAEQRNQAINTIISLITEWAQDMKINLRYLIR